MVAPALFTLSAMLVLILADVRGLKRLRGLAKTLASTGFLWAALEQGALGTPFGQSMLVAFTLSWLGDVALLGTSNRSFLSGLALFLLGHLGFAVSFLMRGISPWGLGLGLVLVAPVTLWTHRWLDPHVKGRMRRPVQAYLGVISSMVALSLATVIGRGDARLVVAAVLFLLSDLFVAREKFVEKSKVNTAVGLPLYYVAQLVFAWALTAWT